MEYTDSITGNKLMSKPTSIGPAAKYWTGDEKMDKLYGFCMDVAKEAVADNTNKIDKNESISRMAARFEVIKLDLSDYKNDKKNTVETEVPLEEEIKTSDYISCRICNVNIKKSGKANHIKTKKHIIIDLKRFEMI